MDVLYLKINNDTYNLPLCTIRVQQIYLKSISDTHIEMAYLLVLKHVHIPIQNRCRNRFQSQLLIPGQRYYKFSFTWTELLNNKSYLFIMYHVAADLARSCS